MESAQRIHASRGWCEMHANQFWWVWPLWFRRFCSFSNLAKFPFLNMDYSEYSPWGSKNRTGSKKFHASAIKADCHSLPYKPMEKSEWECWHCLYACIWWLRSNSENLKLRAYYAKRYYMYMYIMQGIDKVHEYPYLNSVFQGFSSI